MHASHPTYFSIPNPMAIPNVTQDGGRVIKGSAIMVFSLDPKECLDDAAGDLQMISYSLFYKKCQEVDMVSKLILLGVCVFLASGYGWVTVMHEIPISSAQPLTSLPYPRTQ
jgi:hypothetical protein